MLGMILVKQKSRMIIVTILVLLLIFAVSPLSVHAQDTSVEPENVGVTTVCPEETPDSEIQTRSTGRPSKVWNLKEKGRYNFKGTIKNAGTTLYTDYKFNGKTKYSFFVKNTGKSLLTVKAKRLTHTYTTQRIKAGESAIISFFNIKASTEFYLVFSGSSFSGYIN